MKKFSSITRVNSRHISRNKKLRTIALYGVAAVLVLLLLPKLFSYVASLALSPLHAFDDYLKDSSNSLPQYLRDRSTLIAELDRIKSQYAAVSGERFTIDLLSAENRELRSLLGDSGEKRLVAGVIGRPNKLPYDVLVLDKGSEDGILEGAPVFIASSTVIGVVNKVFQKNAVVELITSPGFTASVYILGPDIYTTAEGVGGGQLRVGVPQGIQLSEGDLVILPSIASGVYGEISVVDSVPTRPEQYGYVSPQTPLASLRLVSVGDAPLEPVSFEEAQAIVTASKHALFEVPVPEGLLITTDSASSTGTSTASSSASTSVPLP